MAKLESAVVTAGGKGSLGAGFIQSPVPRKEQLRQELGPARCQPGLPSPFGWSTHIRPTRLTSPGSSRLQKDWFFHCTCCTGAEQ